MRIIFDENIPWPMAEWFPSYEVTSVQREGWSGIANGDLIKKIDDRFDVFITADKNFRYQQNLRDRKIAILELPTNRWPRLLALKETILLELSTLGGSGYKIVAP